MTDLEQRLRREAEEWSPSANGLGDDQSFAELHHLLLEAADALEAVRALHDDEDDSFYEALDQAYTDGALGKNNGSAKACRILDAITATIRAKLRAALAGEDAPR